jgi:hypothetical protein
MCRSKNEAASGYPKYTQSLTTKVVTIAAGTHALPRGEHRSVQAARQPTVFFTATSRGTLVLFLCAQPLESFSARFHSRGRRDRPPCAR